MPAADLEARDKEITRLRADLMECVETLGVRPIYWNGAHQAFINQTNVPVKFFETRKECQDWCAATNVKFGTEGLPKTGNSIEAEMKRLRVALAEKGAGQIHKESKS